MGTPPIGASRMASRSRTPRPRVAPSRLSSRRTHELLAADPVRGLEGAQVLAHAIADLAQHGVAGRVAVGVVDRLEVVDVGDDRAATAWVRGRRWASSATRDTSAPAVEEARQLVDDSEVAVLDRRAPDRDSDHADRDQQARGRRTARPAHRRNSWKSSPSATPTSRSRRRARRPTTTPARREHRRGADHEHEQQRRTAKSIGRVRKQPATRNEASRARSSPVRARIQDGESARCDAR